MKKPKQLERYFKGAANHRRIAILALVGRNEGVTVAGLAVALGANMKTISQHSRALVHAGLLNKQYRGQQVLHFLSPYGRAFLKFMQTF
jgi:DNA-binding transcriptional ArsR family regulator